MACAVGRSRLFDIVNPLGRLSRPVTLCDRLTCLHALIISAAHRELKASVMKVRSSLKSLKNRHKDCRVVRRKGRVYVINKTQKRFKARQG